MISERFLFGGDYNPEQWIDRPGILDEDIRLMKKAHVNVVSLGIFSWAEEEPEEGVYKLDWLADIIHRLYESGISTILATPSGARPRWLAEKYPEVLRVDAERRRHLFGGRENHCLTSPIYRRKVRQIDLKLAERFGKDPAVILWHVSNEFCGECHCPLCQDAFRGWVRKKYKTVDALNHAYWARFWSHTYDSFDQIESPSPIGEDSISGLLLDWKKYTSDQTIDFMKAEIAALREGGAVQPVTTNMMYNFDGINYGKMAKEVDVISWDSYPEWYDENLYRAMERHSLNHDLMRCLKDQSFLLMESCPSGVNVDVIDARHDLSGYAVVAAPMLYSMSDETAERLRKFAEDGGILILTFWTGIVDENDLVYTGGAPHGLTEAAGLRLEEIDALPDGRGNVLEPAEEGGAGSLTERRYRCSRYCELDHLSTAKALLVYGEDFYAGRSALSVNHYGKGLVYYLSTWPHRSLLNRLMKEALTEAGVQSLVEVLPKKTAACEREKGGIHFLFLQNFSGEKREAVLRTNAEQIYSSGEHGERPDFGRHSVQAGEKVCVEAFSTKILRISVFHKASPLTCEPQTCRKGC